MLVLITHLGSEKLSLNVVFIKYVEKKQINTFKGKMNRKRTKSQINWSLYVIRKYACFKKKNDKNVTENTKVVGHGREKVDDINFQLIKWITNYKLT